MFSLSRKFCNSKYVRFAGILFSVLLLSAAGSAYGMYGTYTEQNGVAELNFKSNGKVYLATIFGMETEGKYEVDGDKVKINFGGHQANQIFTILEDGALRGMGSVYRKKDANRKQKQNELPRSEQRGVKPPSGIKTPVSTVTPQATGNSTPGYIEVANPLIGKWATEAIEGKRMRLNFYPDRMESGVEGEGMDFEYVGYKIDEEKVEVLPKGAKVAESERMIFYIVDKNTIAFEALNGAKLFRIN